MDDSIRYPEGETLGKAVSGFTGRALDLLAVFGRQEVKGHLRVRTLALRVQCAPGAASGNVAPSGFLLRPGGLRSGSPGLPSGGPAVVLFSAPTYSGLDCTTGSPHQFVLSC